ncbi:hypothetical protein [Thermoflexus sp.]|uniref:hypothetical protein n=1 Tax=Thermoflexus sp. TaxID=1969742 RepID=UPI0025E1B352|nr:hypothetical protein [Thermoflexus sp.]MCS6964184.1 hypothetical protein [Thermoflexus sp.]MCX7691188.1 hypothetical protein [Thermoflexus sp.]MDW8184703.1 hypothetical protein [Anaerolineae bacterium]
MGRLIIRCLTYLIVGWTLAETGATALAGFTPTPEPPTPTPTPVPRATPTPPVPTDTPTPTPEVIPTAPPVPPEPIPTPSPTLAMILPVTGGSVEDTRPLLPLAVLMIGLGFFLISAGVWILTLRKDR